MWVLYVTSLVLYNTFLCTVSGYEQDAHSMYLLGRDFQYTRYDYANALLAYEKADAIMTNDDKANFDFCGMYNDMGVLALNIGDLQLAENAFIKALHIAPDFIPALSNLASIKHSLGDIETAMKLYEIAVELPNRSPEVVYNFGAFLLQVGRQADARKYWQQVLEMKPDMHHAIASLASMQCGEGKLLDSYDMYERAKDITYREQSMQHFYGYSFQQLLGVIPMVFNSTFHIVEVREKYIRNLVRGVASLPVDSVPKPMENLGCGALGYYLIYQGFNDIIPRQLHAVLLSRVSSSYLFGDWPRGVTEPGSAGPLFFADNPLSAAPADTRGPAEKRLRVAFMSSFFYHHSVGLLLQGVIKGISRSAFHKTLIYFSGMPIDNVTTALIEACDRHLVLPAKTNLLRETISSRNAILALELDVLVFGEIGMDGATYFMSFTRLARRSVVFWGHATSSGVVDFSVMRKLVTSRCPLHQKVDDGGECDGGNVQVTRNVSRQGQSTLLSTWNRGGPDYFVSSEMFESQPFPQHRYSERLILQQGLTTFFERPLKTLSAAEMQLPVGDSGPDQCSGPITRDSCLRLYDAALPHRVHLLDHLAASTSPSLSALIALAGISPTSFRLYGVPQTLYKLCPELVLLFGRVLSADEDGILVLPEGSNANVASNAKGLMRQTIGDALFRRVLFTRQMTGREFMTLCGVVDVVLDTFPVGGGRSSFEIFSTGTPIVLYFPKTSILQLTYGLYRTMGIDCKLCIAHTDEDYIAGAVAIASNKTLQSDLRRDILSSNHRLYANMSVLQEWERMLHYISSVPRPVPYEHYRQKRRDGQSNKSPLTPYDLDNCGEDVRVAQKEAENINISGEIAPEIEMALSIPYEGLEPIILSKMTRNTNSDPDTLQNPSACQDEALEICLKALATNGTNIAIAFLLSRGGHPSVVQEFTAVVASVEAFLGHSIPGEDINEVIVIDSGGEGFSVEEKVEMSALFPMFSFHFDRPFVSKSRSNAVRVALNVLSTVFKVVSPRHVLVLPTLWFMSGDKKRTEVGVNEVSKQPKFSSRLTMALRVMMSSQIVEEQAVNAADSLLLMRQPAHVVVLDDPRKHHWVDGQWLDAGCPDTNVTQAVASIMDNSVRALSEFLSGSGKPTVYPCLDHEFQSYETDYCLYHNINTSTSPGLCSCVMLIGRSVTDGVKQMCRSVVEPSDPGTGRLFCTWLNEASSYDANNPGDLPLPAFNNTELESISPYLSAMMNLHLHPTLWDLDAVSAVILRDEEQFTYNPNRQGRHGYISHSDIRRYKRRNSVHPSLLRSREARRGDWASHQRAAIVFDREDSAYYGTFTAVSSADKATWSEYHYAGAVRFAVRLIASGVRILYLPM